MNGTRRAPADASSLKIGLIGTRGVPARYGGFETCVEEVGQRLADRGHQVVVYCRRAPGQAQLLPTAYRGMKLVHLPAMRRRSLETLSHTAASAAHLLRNPVDVGVVFNCANAPLLPLLRARDTPVATHVDGLEWRRAKWGPVGQRYYRAAERLAVRWSDALIADAVGIQSYYASSYGVSADLISYGAPAVRVDASRLGELGLSANGYHLVVARFEPENHVAEIVRGFVASSAQLPLVVVGSAPYSDEYTRRIHEASDSRVRLLGGVWDQDLLDQLYANARSYLHGHSVGGTNPSLLRALGAGVATDAFDVSFNREVLGSSGRFFATPAELSVLIEDSEADPAGAAVRGEAAALESRRYDWDDVADRYEALCRRLVRSNSAASNSAASNSTPSRTSTFQSTGGDRNGIGRVVSPVVKEGMR